MVESTTLPKVQHLFSNAHIQQKVLSEMNNKTVSLVRKWFGLNTHSTRDIIFHPQWEGLGVVNVIWVYTSMRISHILNILNMMTETLGSWLDLEYHWSGLGLTLGR